MRKKRRKNSCIFSVLCLDGYVRKYILWNRLMRVLFYFILMDKQLYLVFRYFFTKSHHFLWKTEKAHKALLSRHISFFFCTPRYKHENKFNFSQFPVTLFPFSVFCDLTWPWYPRVHKSYETGQLWALFDVSGCLILGIISGSLLS